MLRMQRATRAEPLRELLWAFISALVGILIVGLATPVIVLRPYWMIYGLGMAAAIHLYRQGGTELHGGGSDGIATIGGRM
jgi:hypothetical protein